jgi:hypothetical protein
MTTALPVLHRLMMMRAGFAHAGSASQAGPCRPNGLRKTLRNPFIRPYWPLKIQSHSIDDATIGTIEGMKKRRR